MAKRGVVSNARRGILHVIVLAYLSFACLRAFAGDLTAASTSNVSGGYISVHNVDAAGLLQNVAWLTKTPFVANVEEGQRSLSVTKEFASAEQLFADVAGMLDMQLARVGDVLVMRPACFKTRDKKLSDSSLAESVSLHFQQQSASNLFSVMHVNASLDRAGDLLLYERRNLVVHVKDVSRRNVVTAAAHALGMDIDSAVEQQVVLARGDISACSNSKLEPVSEKSEVARQLRARRNHCPYRAEPNDPKERRCDPLEYFALTSLEPAGYIEWNRRRVALVAAPDRYVYGVMAGGYLGRDYGKLMAVGQEGLDIREIIQDQSGEWGEEQRVLKYGEAIVPGRNGLNKDYLQVDSPQKTYDTVAHDAYAFVIWMNETAKRCRLSVPDISAEISLAQIVWRKKHESLLSLFSVHGEGYADRVASDYAVTKSTVVANANKNFVLALDRYFAIMQGVDPHSFNAYCHDFAHKLGSPQFNPKLRFADRLEVLAQCQEKSTCLNFLMMRDVE